MSDFIYSQQCDELIDGQYYDGQYIPNEQDLIDMAETRESIMDLDRQYDYIGEDDDYPEMDW
jgi:hypothetical protein